MSRLSVSWLTALLLLAVPASASAATLHADPGSSRTALPCSEADPCELQAALTQAVAGDTVAVRAGAYTLTSGVVVGPGVHVVGAVLPDRPLISSAYDLNLGAGTPGARMSGVDFAGSGASGQIVVQNNAVLEDARVTAAEAEAVLAYQGATVRDTFARSTNGYAAISAYGGDVSTPGRLINVTAFGYRGIAVYGYAAGSPCAALPGHADLTNVIARGEAADLHVNRSNLDGCSTSVGAYAEYSNFRTVGGNASLSEGPGNQRTPALTDDLAIFVGSDGHQRSGSPTVDAGTTSPRLGSKDPDGHPRTVGSAPDIGADELPLPPEAGPLSVADVVPTSAVLSAPFTPGTAPTTAVIELGTTTAYGTTVASRTSSPVTGEASGLTPGTVYHARLRAYTTGAQAMDSFGPDAVFTTPAAGSGPGAGPGATEVLSGVMAPAKIKRRELVRKGLRASFALARGASWTAVLTGRRGTRSRKLASRSGTAAPGNVATRLKVRKRKLRKLTSKVMTLTVTATAAGGGPVSASVPVRLKGR